MPRPETVWCDETHPIWTASSRGLARGEVVARVASRQRGLVTAAQLRWAGCSDHQIGRWVRSGRLRRRHRGVYAVGHDAPARFAGELAALLAVGPDAALTNASGAHVLGLMAGSDGPVHVAVTGRDARSRPGIHVHRTTHPRGAVVVREGMRVVSPPDVLLSLAGTLSPHRFAWTVNEAQALGLVTAAELRELGGSGRWIRGGPALRREAAGPGFTRREAERRLLRLLLRTGLRPTATNARVAGYEVDVWFANARLVVEVDSYAFHGTRAAFERDRAKDAELVAAGLRVIRATWIQIVHEEAALVARIRRAIAAGPESQGRN